jgi:endo-1,4-beta-xylanase
MRLKSRYLLLAVVPLLFIFVAYSAGQTITSNATGRQGTYYYEYWKDGGSGTMTLKEDCGFDCNWSCPSSNILFRKGIRPGSRAQVVKYTADFVPTGNSYLSIYGWFKNPLVEYYIIESYGTYKPGGGSKGTIQSDSGSYTIHQNSRTGPSIEGNKTFQQYWSIRTVKRTSGTITCGNHFKAWDSMGMKVGTFYEVSFNVEGYHSSGNAKVTAQMDSIRNSAIFGHFAPETNSGVRATNDQGHFTVTDGNKRTITFSAPVNQHASLKVYNCRGQEIARLAKREYLAGQHSVSINTSDLARGVYYWMLK